MNISTLGWILVGAAAWLAVAAVVGVLLGRVIRLRDRQAPRDEAPAAAEARYGPVAADAEVPRRRHR